MKKVLTIAVAFGLVSFSVSAHKAHVHGKGKLEISFDENSLEMDFEVPMESILGHERAPKNEDEKKKEADEIQRFVNALKLGAKIQGCTLGSEKSEVEREGSHADLNVDLAFQCTKSPAGTNLKILAFETFPRLTSVETVIVGPTTQKSVSLSKSKPSFQL